MPTAFRPMTARALALIAIVAACAAGFAVLATPPRAQASSNQISIMMDDNQLLYRGAAKRQAALARMKQLGVEWVRVTVLWSYVTENAKSKRYRKKFKPDDPRTYPRGNWDRYDELVFDAAKYGIQVYFNVTGPGPSWVHKRTRGKAKKTYRPKEREFYRFVKAVATRYSGTYRDENAGRFVLPRVRFWSLYNEPNQGGWLTPQWERSRELGKVIAQSPIVYRRLYLFGYKALRDAGALKPDTIVLAGETAPLGSTSRGVTSAMHPATFIREFFCLDPAGNPYTGVEASARDCALWDRFGGKLETTAWAHHPYTKKLPPNQRDTNPDSISMANIGDLGTLLDVAASKTGRVNAGLNTILTEFGYETNPPDPFSGVSLNEQADYINVGDFLAYRDPRIIGQTQFMLLDAPKKRRIDPSRKSAWFDYQSGLFDAAGKAKPAALSYAFPFVALPDPGGSGTVGFWGQARFLPNNAGTVGQIVVLQHRPQGAPDSAWQVVGDPITLENPLGFFTAARTAPGPGVWRAAWVKEGSPPVFTREVIIG